METLQHWENDALLVDDLLDFSSGDIGEGEECMVTCIRREEEKNSSCLKNSAEICSSQGTIARASQELSEAGDPLFSLAGAEWDWLSSFVEESYKSADNSLAVVTSEEWLSSRGGRKEGHAFTPIIAAGVDGKRPSTTSWLRMGASSQILDVGSSPLIETAPAQHSGSSWRREWDKRSRSKRCSRSGGRVWSLQRVMRATEEDDDQEASSLDYEPYPSFNSCSRKASTMQEGRRCSHCQVQKTPQWRRGPFGPKTLCNACGVRYKSGRLLPEYRPAASPTFVSELHSNSHRRVLEMRTFKSCVAQEPHHDEFSSCSQESSL